MNQHRFSYCVMHGNERNSFPSYIHGCEDILDQYMHDVTTRLNWRVLSNQNDVGKDLHSSWKLSFSARVNSYPAGPWLIELLRFDPKKEPFLFLPRW